MTVARARRLRRTLTDAERALWRALANRQVGGLKFRRQHPIGRYVVDFCCESRKLVVEVDGSQHTTERDEPRTRELESAGYHVVRFWNTDVLTNIEGVIGTILELATFVNTPLPLGEGHEVRLCGSLPDWKK